MHRPRLQAALGDAIVFPFQNANIDLSGRRSCRAKKVAMHDTQTRTEGTE